MSAGVQLGDIDTRSLLKELGQFDKQLVKETRRKIVKSARVIVRDARKAIPAQPPMSGWRTVPATNGRTRGGAGWPEWTASRSGFSVRVGKKTRLSRTTSRWDLVRVVAKGATASIYEFAAQGQTPSGAQFVANLNRYHRAPRAVWPAVDSNRDAVERDILDAVTAAAATINKRIG